MTANLFKNKTLENNKIITMVSLIAISCDCVQIPLLTSFLCLIVIKFQLKPVPK